MPTLRREAAFNDSILVHTRSSVHANAHRRHLATSRRLTTPTMEAINASLGDGRDPRRFAALSSFFDARARSSNFAPATYVRQSDVTYWSRVSDFRRRLTSQWRHDKGTFIANAAPMRVDYARMITSMTALRREMVFLCRQACRSGKISLSTWQCAVC